jgi:hypothetical protein
VIGAIIGALSRAVRRDLGTFGSLTVNNFFLFVALMAYGNAAVGLAPRSAYAFLLMLGVLLLFPLSSDPLAKIPATRLGLWPLSGGQRALLRLAGMVLSPVVWVALFLLMRAAPPLGLAFVGLAVSIRSAAWTGRHRGIEPLRAVPAVPCRFGQLIRKDLRQMLSVLDTYVAVLLSLGGCCYRYLYAHPDPAAFPIFAILIATALSTYAQCLFSLDGPGGATRYGLLPVGGRQALLAKDAAFGIVLLALVLPLDCRAGLTFGLVALAIGHYPSLTLRLHLQRWRFVAGRVKYGGVQMVMGIALAVAESRNGIVYLAIAASFYLLSVYLSPTGKRIR